MKKYFVVLFIIALQNIYAQDLILNEIVADNATGYTIDGGKTPDWIEIKNISSTTINLSDYWLSDKNGKSTPWQFPNVNIAAGTYYLVPATAPENVVAQWETIIDKGNTWKYIVPTTEPSSTWNTLGFDDASWGEGPSGFGYGDGDDATVLSNCISVYLRKTFTITDKSQIVDAFLHINFDDGFVAYLNGQEIARSSLNGYPPLFDESASGHEAESYQAFALENIEDFLQEGNNILCIQVHNTDINSSDLSAIPIFTVGYLQDKPLSNGVSSFISISNTNAQANFKINASNETIYLYKNTTVIDSIEINDLPVDVSVGRISNSVYTLRYFSTPTPKYANSTMHYVPKILSKPVISKSGGICNTSFYVKMYSSDGGIIYYTVNGSDPTETSLLYTDSISISKSTNLKARVFKKGYLPSAVNTQTYLFFKRQQKLPIVSVTVKYEDFFNYNTGIYVEGPNADEENPHFGANYWQDWERPAHVEVFMPGGETAFALDLGVKIQGNYSRANAQKSLKFYARPEYGEKAIEYQIFKDKPIHEFQCFILRNSGNDFNNTQMRDGMQQSLCRNMGLDRMAYRPAILYINGQYYGIQNFREKINKDFIVSNSGLQLEDISLLDNFGTVIHGTSDNFFQLYDFISNNDLSIPENYQKVKQDLDIDNYIKYNLVEMFVVNQDWPGNNVKFWRENSANGRWRYILYDLDFGFNPWNDNKQDVNMLDFALTNDETIGWPNPPWSTLMLRKLTQNQEFNNLFMNHVADRLNTTFLPDSISIFIDSLATLIYNEIPYHALRWNGSANDMYSAIQVMKDFGNVRGEIMRGHFETYFNTGGSYMLHISTSEPNPGRIHINTIDLHTFPWSGKYFNNVPISLTAIPAPGYTFVRWEGDVSSTNPTIDITTATETNIHAVFSYSAASVPNVYFTEINYNSSDSFQSADWVEIYNAKDVSQDVSGWILKDDQQYNSYKIPNGFIIPPYSFAVLCADTVMFDSQYSTQVIQRTGNCNFIFSKQQETLRLYDSLGYLIDKISYNDDLPWPKKCDGYGYTLELTDITADRTNPNIWRAATLQGSPGENNELINLTFNREQIVINEINFNSHVNSESGDWIEFYNMGTADIDISEWVVRDKSNNIFIIPQGTIMYAKSYLVFVNDAQKFVNVFPEVPFIPINISLSSGGDAVRLYDQYEFLVDSMQYSIFNIITLSANGSGRTLSLISPELDNSNYINWGLGDAGGTPGAANIIFVQIVNPVKNSNIVYPNPCYNNITVQTEMPYTIIITDLRGVTVYEQCNVLTSNCSLESLTPGVYSVCITSPFHNFSQVIEKK